MSGLLGAELLKQGGQRSWLFWGFAAVPLFTTLVAFALESAVPSVGGTPLAAAVHPLRSAMRAMSVAGNPIAQLFFAVGGAGLFALEYRHSAWRSLVPRRGRAALMLVKGAAFALLAAASLALVLAGDLAASLVLPLARGLPMADAPPATAAGVALSFLLSYAELLALGATVALLAVLTRSALGAILPAFLLSLAAASAAAMFGPTGDQLARAPLPTFTADAVRGWIWAAPNGASGASALLAAALLLGWTVAAFGAAILAFARQDLAQE
jgi:hypothetical protein